MKTNMLTKLTTGLALSAITATMLHATNGDNLIAVGAKARGMGGTGIAVSHGAESALSNPAMITSVEGTEVSFGGTLFMPRVSTQFLSVAPSVDSAARTSVIPEVSIAHKINENWYIGIGMFGTAGMGVDYRKADGSNANMVTNLQLMQFAMPIAYKTGGFSASVAPILQYGNLDINYEMGGNSTGAGLAQDFGLGWTAGLSYEFDFGLTLGAVYKSAIEMNYDGQLSGATGPFVALGAFPAPMGDTLEQPEEFGVGFAYEMGQHTIAFDWKRIKWASATGYKDFGWEDQDVYAVGYQFATDAWALRLGYNHGSSAVVEQDGTTKPGAALNMFNLLGFPATSEDHYTVGGSYYFTKAVSFDLAYVYSPSNDLTFDITGLPLPPGFPPADIITTEHKEHSLAFQLTFDF